MTLALRVETAPGAPRVGTFAGTAAEWDAFVRDQPGWTHFHLHGWSTVITTVFGHETVLLAARDDRGTLRGVLPLTHVRSAIFGHFLVSMPFVNYGGPLGDEEAQRALVTYATAIAIESRTGLLQLRARGALPTDLAVSKHKLTVLVDIPAGGPDALFKQLSHKMRTKVRRPQKEGVEVRFGPDQLEPFHRVLAHNMRDLGTPVQSRRFYEAIADQFGDSAWFACGYLRGKAVTGGCGFAWGDEMEITWSSSLRESTPVRPGYLLHWSFLERAAQQGLRIGNFGRSTPGSGTHDYKRQWGGRDETLWWYYRARDGHVSTPSADDARFAWGPRIWKRLPVGLTTRLGPYLVRSMP